MALHDVVHVVRVMLLLLRPVYSKGFLRYLGRTHPFSRHRPIEPFPYLPYPWVIERRLFLHLRSGYRHVAGQYER